ncbi:hypothetical protein KGF54_000481 [Candida jiufengensis]|uniref:uncharacterized protein n=1 Tax=Candida jiufengensis TaxID=497108 RepID=UPI0022256354|nr:uncharacterized protein KGF54_000481 [Candida jiufengensis]KAI5956863.1 hypothetical protein KGF54_000481 [Candida jiufengensis]
MKKKIPKLSKKQLQQTTTSSEPTTSEEWLEQGSIDEESGDRWLGSDIPKALRFYQKAYHSYLKSIAEGGEQDAYYNSCRLLLQVYLLIKEDGLVLENLSGIDELYVSDSILANLEQILELHRKSLKVIGDNSDLLFNTVIVYIEILEASASNDSEINLGYDDALSIYNNASDILLNLGQKQYNEFQSFVKELNQLSENEPNDQQSLSQSNNGEGKNEEAVSEEIIQPVDLFETVISSFRLIQALFRTLDLPDLSKLKLQVEPLELFATSLATVLINDYSDVQTKDNSMLETISRSQVNEIKINMIVLNSLTFTSFEELLMLWNQTFVSNFADEIPEKYLAFSDEIQSLLDKKDITIHSINQTNDINDKQTFFDILKYQCDILKKAQDLINIELSNKRKQPSGKELNIGSIIVQLCDVYIERADIYYQLSIMTNFEPTTNHKETYITNCKNLLKSAMTLANSSGGLRERALEKMNRDKKKNQSVFRLCLLENKTTIEELDKIMTRARWTKEYAELTKLQIYNDLIQQIPISLI